ncbi:MAG TPA: GNAT family N-acetyltransferase [Micromonosporaceae bacterium]
MTCWARPFQMSADQVRVRPAVPEDDATLLALDQVSWPPGTVFPSVLRRKTDRFFNEHDFPDQHLVAEYRGQVVGYVKVRPVYPMPEGAHVFAIHGIVVAEHARGRGVASALLGAAEEHVRVRGGRKLRLGVLATNHTAYRLYERHGYLVEGRHRNEFLIDGEYVNDIQMAKWL